MDQSLELSSVNLFYMMRGALVMMLILMCISVYPRRKENSILNFLFWLLATLSSLIFFMNFGLVIDELRENAEFRNIRILINLCFIPMIVSYFLKILIPESITRRRIFLLLSPTIIFLLIHFITHNNVLLTLSFIYTAFVAVISFLFVVFISIRYDRLLKKNFSNIDNKTVGWVRVVIYIFIVWYVIWLLKTQINSRLLDSAYYIGLIIIWITIYKHSIKHVMVFHAQELFETSKEDPDLSELINEKFDPKLDEYMKHKHAWLNPSLTLHDLALALNTNRTYLSEYFNKTLNTNFYDYLNSYRIKHACEILISEPNLSILQVCEKSGFNSLSTLQRAFKKHIGCTPAQYRKEYRCINSQSIIK